MTPDLRNLLNMFGSTDQGYSSGQRYAQSIAGGENIPGMIAPGVSYSMENPEGFTQSPFYNAGPVPVMPSAPTQGTPSAPNEGFVQMPSAPQGVAMPTPINFTPLVTSQESLVNLANAFTPVENVVVDNIPNVVVDNLPSVGSSPIDFSFNPFIENVIPSVIQDEPFRPQPINVNPQPVDMPVDPMPSFFVPEVPSVSLQDLPITPVGMPENVLQEIMQEQDAKQELQNIIDQKEILQEIPAADGIRNEYQMAINDFINESPTNMEVYKDELPVGSAINLGIPSLFENLVAPAVIPGLGLVKEASQSFNNNDFTPPPSPTPSLSTPSSGIDYSKIYEFGR